MSNVTLKAVAGLGSIVCLLLATVLVLKLGVSSGKQTTLSPTQGAVAAMQNLQLTVPALEAYSAANGTFAGMTVQTLQAAGGDALPTGFQIGWVEATQYCVEDTAAGGTAYLVGPGGALPALGACPASA